MGDAGITARHKRIALSRRDAISATGVDRRRGTLADSSVLVNARQLEHLSRPAGSLLPRIPSHGEPFSIGITLRHWILVLIEVYEPKSAGAFKHFPVMHTTNKLSDLTTGTA